MNRGLWFGMVFAAYCAVNTHLKCNVNYSTCRVSKAEALSYSCLDRCLFQGDYVRGMINASLFRDGLFEEVNDYTVDEIVKEVEDDCKINCLNC